MGIVRELIRRQQVGGDGQLLLSPVGIGERKGSLCGVQRFVAVRQRKVFKGDRAGILVDDRQMAGGVLAGEVLREGAGQIVQRLLLFFAWGSRGISGLMHTNEAKVSGLFPVNVIFRSTFHAFP